VIAADSSVIIDSCVRIAHWQCYPVEYLISCIKKGYFLEGISQQITRLQHIQSLSGTCRWNNSELTQCTLNVTIDHVTFE
jgi:hypothetical protein